ncbi:bifunctional UDP-sugar hydrolase/5'-nucleotidase [Parashewanella curva]|uniref:Bifunctional UDP-sugar hydrolase/5'-nucleotidase n=1 Tax=Parashewanella curva TaxID=2338552 RepID=A0A3L8Q2K4_9GAMM|nr:bifunctional UDP-sugar hydrolase/5'-nucleotidase UshA [Parashewanella curva]RLV61093.1 bifunctional UDP-sugar hydrolase/5'-nucleotidase [Parashewanella curva]
MSTALVKGFVAASFCFSVLFLGFKHHQANDVPKCEDYGDQCLKFTILHTNDNHGRFWHNKHNEYGMPARASLIKSIRDEVSQQGSQVLLLSGGDVNTGVPESDLQDAVPDFIGMNLMKYDAMAVGNHEFDNELSVLDMQRELAKFPMLSANIYKKNSDTNELVRYFEPYKIFTVGNLKLAVIGLTTKDTAKLGNPQFIASLTFTDPLTEIKQVIKEIKEQNKADLIMAVTHMGHFIIGKHGSNAPGDVSLARGLNKGDLQAIIGGHSQNPVCMEPYSNRYSDFKPGKKCTPDIQNGTFIMQAYEWGKYIGRADFEYFNGKLHLAEYQLIPVNLTEQDSYRKRKFIEDYIEPDPEVKAKLQPYQEKGQEKLDVNIAKISERLEGKRSIVRFQQTNLGHFIATAHREAHGADFAIMNSGGVRASIEKGNVSYRDVLTVQPFGNEVYKVTMSGTDLSDYLGKVASNQIESGAYAQLVGLKMSVNCKIKTAKISEINGKKFNNNESYTFTIPGFNAAGGDGFPRLVGSANQFPDAEVIDNSGLIDEQVLYQFFKSKSENNTKTIDVSEFEPSTNDVTYLNSKDHRGCKLN